MFIFKRKLAVEKVARRGVPWRLMLAGIIVACAVGAPSHQDGLGHARSEHQHDHRRRADDAGRDSSRQQK